MQMSEAKQLPDITSDDVKQMVRESGLVWVSFHDCSDCGYPCAYMIDGNQVSYDSGCDCTRGGSSVNQSSFGDVADFHNMQNGEYEGVSWRQKIRDALAGTPSAFISVKTASLAQSTE